MRLARRLAPALVWIVVAGCAGALPPAGWTFPRHGGFAGGGPAALGAGTLVADDGCLYLGPAANGTLIVWPPDYHLEVRDDVAVVLDGSRVVGTEGAEVTLGGGFYDDLAFVAGQVDGGLPDCPATEFFLSSGTPEDH